jgi:hypothetical protein
MGDLHQTLELFWLQTPSSVCLYKIQLFTGVVKPSANILERLERKDPDPIILGRTRIRVLNRETSGGAWRS